MNHTSAMEFQKRPESLIFWCRLWQFEFPVQMAGCCHAEVGLRKLEMSFPVHHNKCHWSAQLIFGIFSAIDQSDQYMEFALTFESINQSGSSHYNCKTGAFLDWCLFCILGRNNPNMTLNWQRTSRFRSRISEGEVFFLWVKVTSIQAEVAWTFLFLLLENSAVTSVRSLTFNSNHRYGACFVSDK